MNTALNILIGIFLLLIGFVLGIIASIWYYENVVKPVDDEQRGGSSMDDDRVYFDCEAV